MTKLRSDLSPTAVAATGVGTPAWRRNRMFTAYPPADAGVSRPAKLAASWVRKVARTGSRAGTVADRLIVAPTNPARATTPAAAAQPGAASRRRCTAGMR